jgi:hypothetical protein
LVNKDTAIVHIYESLDYQYSDCEETTFELYRYDVGLIKANGTWYIAEVSSDDMFFQEFAGGGFDVVAELTNYDNIREELLRERRTSAIKPKEPALSQTAQVNAISGNNYVYNKANAVNYALTYSTKPAGGYNSTSPTISYKNDYFLWDTNSCMLFVSQCVWAGFGGSNSSTSIGAKYGMDDIGSDTSTLKTKWFSTASAASSSWSGTNSFLSYINNSNNDLNEVGITSKQYFVPSNSSTLTTGYLNDRSGGSFSGATTTVPYSDLIGAVMIVRGSAGRFGHAIFINNATGADREHIYYTAYNDYCKNKQLSTCYIENTSTYDYCVVIPQTFRSGATGNRLTAKLQNAVTVGTTLSLQSYSISAAWITTKIYAPDSNGNRSTATLVNTYNAVNATTWTGNYTFNTVGTWTIEVLAGGIPTFTYVVRVV